MESKRDELKNKIWEKRVEIANANRRQAQLRHFLTNDEFYLEEMTYWQDVKKLTEKYSTAA